MSQLSQTQAVTEEPRGARPALVPRFALSMAVVAVIVGFTTRGVWPAILALGARGHLHAPDTALWARLSPAIRIHLVAALAALALGAVLMGVRKGRLFHRIAGWTWVITVGVVAGSSLFITTLNPGRFSLLHLLTAWTLLALPLGVLFARRHAVETHRRAMMGLFFGGFAINVFIAMIPGRVLWRLLFG